MTETISVGPGQMDVWVENSGVLGNWTQGDCGLWVSDLGSKGTVPLLSVESGRDKRGGRGVGEMRNEELGLGKSCRKGLWTEETLRQSQR